MVPHSIPNQKSGDDLIRPAMVCVGSNAACTEGALRQAAIAWWPGTVPAGRVDDQPWAFWDLMPTFVELSGAQRIQGYETDGLSLVPYLKGGEAPERDYFYWELHLGSKPVQAARFENWKAVRNGIDKPIEIYDLESDSEESRDLANSRAGSR